jgi:uncharacterized phage-associated protein
MMANVFDVAQFILEQQGEMTAMKLQKLVYYSQAWHIVWTDNVLFTNKIEAWKDGPVCRDLWGQHRNAFRISKIAKAKSSRLSVREAKTIRKIISYYGKKSAQWLSDLTHMEDPWVQARRGLGPDDRSSAEITPKSMMEYYSSL